MLIYKKRLTLLRWSAIAALAVLLLLRWLTKRSAFPGEESDYGTHIAIINWVTTQPSWPPIYNGILGAHLLAAVLHLAGLTIPKAMLVVADLSICLFFLALIRIVVPLGRSPTVAAITTAVLVSVPLLSTMQRDGYFGPIVSTGFYATGIAATLRANTPPSKHALLTPLLWFGAGTFTYPDGFLWCMPVLAIVAYGSIPRTVWFVATAAVVGLEYAFLSKLFIKVTQPGGGNLTWDVPIWISLLWGSLFLVGPVESMSYRRFRLLLLFYFGVAALICSYSVYRTEGLGYYARKLLYPILIFAPLLGAHAWRAGASRFILTASLASLVWFLPTTLRETISTSYYRIAHPRSDFDGADEACVVRAQAEAKRLACKRLLILPGAQGGEPDTWGQRIVRVVAANSYTQEFDPGAAELSALDSTLTNSFPLADLLRSDQYGALTKVFAATHSRVDCFAAGPELVAGKATSKGKCLTVLQDDQMPQEHSLAGARIVGFIGNATCEQIDGWAYAPDHPRQRLTLEILVDSEVAASTQADLPRPDLSSNNIGDGRYGFMLPLPARAKDGREHRISVRATGADALLWPREAHVTCAANASATAK